MLAKLKLYRCDEHAIKWFKSYLSERSQKVKVGSTESDFSCIKYGVPQGSILGPLLFIIYINDLPLMLESSLSDLYADDTILYKSSSIVQTLNLHLNNDFLNVREWCKRNDITINTNKTKSMLIGSERKLQNCDGTLTIFTDGLETIDNVENQKLLGIHIDKSLSWSEQVDHICSIISSRTFLLSRLRSYLSTECLKLFYNSYILTIIDYCCTVWGSTSLGNLEKIHKLQKRAARIILHVSYDTPSKELFEKLGWMTIFTRIKYFQAMLMFKCMNGIAPEYLSDQIHSVSDIHSYSLRSTTAHHLHVPRPKSEYF